MSSCCSDDKCRVEAESVSEICPSCGSKGTSVDPITLKALLTGDALRRGVPPAPRFCATADCPVVYFDHAVPIVFGEDELTVPVHAKHPDDDRVPVCYCFGYTPPKIREEGKIASQTIAAEVKRATVRARSRTRKAFVVSAMSPGSSG